MVRLRSILGISLLLATAPAFAQTAQAYTLTSTGLTINPRQGLASLQFLAGAVTTPCSLFISGNSFAPESRYLVVDSATTIGRPNQTFVSGKAFLTLRFEPQNLPTGAIEANLAIYRAQGHKWVKLGGTVDQTNNLVKVGITQTGTYGLLSTTTTLTGEGGLLLNASRTGNSSWYRVSPDWAAGTVSALDPLQVAPIPYGDYSLSPTLDAIVFSRQVPSLTTGYDLYAANVDGSFPIRLTSLASTAVAGFSIAPGGTAVAFTSIVGTSTQLRRVLMDGSGATSLATIAAGIAGSNQPSWSPDGTKIAFRDGLRLKIVNASTGAVLLNQVLTFAPTGRIAWNWTGVTLAIPAVDGVYTVGSGGGTPVRRLVSAAEVKQVGFNYDTTRLAFLTGNGAGGSNVYVGSATGTSGSAALVCGLPAAPVTTSQGPFADLIWR